MRISGRGRFISLCAIYLHSRNIVWISAEEIYRILNNPRLKSEYDSVLDMVGKILPDYYWAEVKSGEATWDGDGFGYLVALRHYNDVAEYDRIRNLHEDWSEYLGDKTFYDVLSIDMALVPEDKREAEGFIRNVYRSMKRTPEVNLAYSVLKNFRYRGDYDWLLKNYKLVDILFEIGMGEMDNKTRDELIAIIDATRE